jgi:hypothetical protein
MAISWNRAETLIWPENVPWWVDFLELVACAQEEERVIQVCTDYYYVDRPKERAPDIERIRFEIAVKIVRVYDGGIVDQKIFRGSNPRTCQLRESVGTTLYGEPVDKVQIDQWIASFFSR